jgi:hypothetical protein
LSTDRSVNIKCTALKSERAGTLKFIGMMQSDGVGASIIKPTNESQNGGTSTKRKRSPDEEEFTYIHTLSKRKLNTLDNRCVVIDPNRRYLLFCMHESSTKQASAIYRYVSSPQSRCTICFNILTFVFNRYTSCQKHNELKRKKYRKIKNQLKDNNERVCIAEKALSEGPPHRKNNAETHLKYLDLRQQHNGVLNNH